MTQQTHSPSGVVDWSQLVDMKCPVCPYNKSTTHLCCFLLHIIQTSFTTLQLPIRRCVRTLKEYFMGNRHCCGMSQAHSVNCQLMQVNTPRLNPSQAKLVQYSIYPPDRDTRLSWPRWMATYWDGLPALRRSFIQVLTRPDLEQLRWSRPMH